jgi:hypothetical protein
MDNDIDDENYDDKENADINNQPPSPFPSQYRIDDQCFKMPSIPQVRKYRINREYIIITYDTHQIFRGTFDYWDTIDEINEELYTTYYHMPNREYCNSFSNYYFTCNNKKYMFKLEKPNLSKITKEEMSKAFNVESKAEIFDFINYSAQTGIPVRFLELMKIGEACGSQKDQYISATEIIKVIQTKFSLKPVVSEKDSTSFNYLLDNGAQIGFIASESQAFCGQCSRWRLSADGLMRACLFKDDGLDIKNKTPFERADIYQSLLGMKPAGRPEAVSHLMHVIGG